MANGQENMSALRWFFTRPRPMTAADIENLQAKAQASDTHAVAQFKAAKWNQSNPVGTKCLYLKSEIEGRVVAKTTRAAWASEEYAFVELEHIGMVLLGKVEVFCG